MVKDRLNHRAPGELITNDGPSLFGARCIHQVGHIFSEGSESGFASQRFLLNQN